MIPASVSSVYFYTHRTIAINCAKLCIDQLYFKDFTAHNGQMQLQFSNKRFKMSRIIFIEAPVNLSLLNEIVKTGEYVNLLNQIEL